MLRRNTSRIQSTGSSVELHDNIVDNKWFTINEEQAVVPTGTRKTKRITQPQDDVAEEKGIIGRLWQRWNDHVLLTRIGEFEQNELKTFVAQKLFKIDGILCDEQTRLLLIEKMVANPESITEDFQKEQLVKKHGEKMVLWLRDRLIPSIGCWDELINFASEDYNEFRWMDPLCNWYRGSPDVAARMVQRIQKLAENMYNKVRWSFLVEPGSFTCHLADFIHEFNRVDTFFLNNELSGEESDQSTFNRNHLTKARNRLIPCVEMSRVKLRPLRDHNGAICKDDPRFRRSRIVQEIFDSDQVPDVVGDDPSYGTSDFIHANYVRGGALQNSFICTQAPMKATQEDFWRMVYQERCGLIVMLCAAADMDTLGFLSPNSTEYCPYYWPRSPNDAMTFGNLLIRNTGVDSAKDPMFNVTYLEVSRLDDVRREEAVLVEHWQWDWSTYSDVHWPFRILRRSRLSSTPTVVHCVDGVGRTGTLITLETVLMQFMTGSPVDSDYVFLSSIFVRLQRRCAIANSLQYLFIYRCLLHWMAPYIHSTRHRIGLGLSFPGIGFLPKYETYMREHSTLSIPY